MVKRQARRNLLDFARVTMLDYSPNWHHRLLARYLDDWIAGRIRRLAITMPPGHGKSELVSRRAPAFIFGRNPNARIIAASHTLELAQTMSEDVQEIMDTPDYLELFGRRLPSTAEAARRTLSFFRVAGGRGYYRAAGIGVGISGMRFTHGIIDDPIKDDEAVSPTNREKAWRWYAKVFHTRQARHASILITMTRWHRDDLLGRILKQATEQNSEEWTVLNLPALRPPERTHPEDPRQEGEALWPWFRSEVELERIKKLDRHAFAALYQQAPGDAGGSEWPGSYFGPWIWCEPDDWPESFDVRAIAIDPSMGKGDRHGDYSAIVYVGLKNGLIYVDADLERRPPHEIVRDALGMVMRYKPQYIGIESNGFQEMLLAEFRRQAGGRLTDYVAGVPLSAIPNKEAKTLRIRRLGHAIVDRLLRFKRDCQGCHLLVDQLMDFPNGDHDDGPDALEMAIRLPSISRIGAMT